MKNEEISQKPVQQSHSTGEAYANLARSAWEKPASGAAAKTESFAPHATSGSDMGGPLTPKSGSAELNKDGSAGKPGGGGRHSDHNQGKAAGSTEGHKAGTKNEGVDAQGSSAHEKAGATDKNALKPDGAGEFGKPSDKSSLPTENQNKPAGEGSHSVKPAERKDKQDAALKFLPSLSIA